jgi:hypothetical protein
VALLELPEALLLFVVVLMDIHKARVQGLEEA